MVNSENALSNGTEESEEEKVKEALVNAALGLDKEEEEVPAHLLPAEMDIRPLLAVPIKAVACGNQHSLILTTDGGVFSVGRNMDGQLGIGSRKEARSPVSVQALADTNIVAISCGGDYSVALSDSGTAFAWGNNSSGQLGRAPLEENKDGTDSNTKVVVMKTTRRIIRLQNNIQNSCDVPRPVGGMKEAAPHTGSSEVLAGDSDGIYHGREDFTSSSDEEQVAEWSREAGAAMVKTREGFDALEDVAEDQVEKLLHLTLELFASNVLAEDRELCKKLSKQCIIADNLQAAAKVTTDKRHSSLPQILSLMFLLFQITLLAGKLSQAFDFSLQLIIKRSSANGEASQISDALFAAFLFYFKEAVKSDNKSQGDDEVQQASQRLRKQLLERLISCWQDQGFSFVKLESLFLSSLSDEPQLLQTLVLNLFKPEDDEKEAEEDPVRASSPLSGGSAASSSGGPGPRLVDLFTPEFCLRIGDTCVREMGEEASKWMKLKKKEEEDIDATE